MKILYLLRHAKSSWGDEQLEDHRRPLAPRGRRAAAQMAEHLLEQGIEPALVLCSSALRTRETLAEILPSLGPALGIQIEDALYGATADGLQARIRRIPAHVPSAMVIGHNPGIEELAGALLKPRGRSSAMDQGFPTAALATLELPVDTWRAMSPATARLRSFVTPREL